jgi:hypothetical protein
LSPGLDNVDRKLDSYMYSTRRQLLDRIALLDTCSSTKLDSYSTKLDSYSTDLDSYSTE